MNSRNVIRSLVCLLLAGAVVAGRSATGPLRLAIAWNHPTNGIGRVQAMDVNPPWNLVTPPLQVGRDSLLRYANGRLYVMRPTDHIISVVDPATWSILRSYTLPPGSEPEDIALVGSNIAYVSARQATHLIRLNLTSGATEHAIDFRPFADADGIPDLGGMAFYAGRLLVQVRRLNRDVARGFIPPAYLAVVDPYAGQLVDFDPVVPEVQAIQLAGTPPKRVMQLIPQNRRLFISATGDFFDEGGIEMIDLENWRTMGLVVHESHGLTGADTGPFVMVTPQRGYLVYTTDLTVSSHLNEFTVANGPEGLAIFTEVGFLAPALVFEHIGNRMFFANSDGVEPGVRVFDAATGNQLTTMPVATGGPPSDLALLGDGPFSAEPASLDIALHAGLHITGTTGATYRIEFVTQAEATNWTALTNITLTASPHFWADPAAVTNQIRRYYRAVLAE